MGNRLNKPHMEVEDNKTTGNTLIDVQTTGGTDIQTEIFFVVLLASHNPKTTIEKCLSHRAGFEIFLVV